MLAAKNIFHLPAYFPSLVILASLTLISNSNFSQLVDNYTEIGIFTVSKNGNVILTLFGICHLSKKKKKVFHPEHQRVNNKSRFRRNPLVLVKL